MLIYIAGPITIGDPGKHVNKAVNIANKLIKAGHSVYLPHTTQLWHMISPKPWAFWIRNDLAILARCDCVLRLPGKSKGADIEVQAAERLKLGVYYQIADIPKNKSK